MLLAGCGQNDVQVYRVAKESAPVTDSAQMPPAGMPAAMPAGHGEGAGAAPALQWKLPGGWEEVAPSQMRAASFRVVGKDGKVVDIGVVPMPGMVGRDLENVNRWRSAVSLPPVTEADLPKLAQPVPVSGQTAQVYDQAGEDAAGDKTRIVAAVLRREGIAWFFKMSGDDAQVAAQKPAFVEFLQSLSFPAAAAGGELPPAHPPIGGGMMGGGMAGAAPMAASSNSGKPDWQVPGDWQETSGGQFLVAKFLIGGDSAAVNVSCSAGDGGGLLANINRWRGQLGLSPWQQSELEQQVQSLEAAGGKAAMVEMSGTDARTAQKAGLVALIVPQGGQTWFYKLMGNAEVVAKQKDAFVRFVQSAQYHAS